MSILLVTLILAGTLIPASAAPTLDEQIAALTGQVAEHAAEVLALEQKLLHPPNTRLAVFLTLKSRDALNLDSVELFVNDQPVAAHFYTDRERASLERGGVQQLFIGNVANGEHELKTVITARSADEDFVRRETSHRFRKRPGVLRLQMSLEARAPDYEPRVAFREWE
ncbi:MAG: AraC family transcriptional regulator [Pseudomonadota bacterium]|nr:AraC family transcriptional regulator [Pseudomonadota bacterium]